MLARQWKWILKLLLLTLVFLSPTLAAIALAEELPVTLDGVNEPGLLVKTDRAGLFLMAPTLSTDVEIIVEGIVSRARVTQRFENPHDACVEAVYVFPLPEDAAVDELEMKIGDRVIRGVIKEREEAKRTYEQAKREGRKASLLEQERPNIFTASVANIAAREIIEITIEYQETIEYDSGVFALRFPTVVAPRYIPGSPLECDPAGTGCACDSSDVPDASRITPPVALPGSVSANPVSFTVEIYAGTSLRRVESPSHSVAVTTLGDHHYAISLPAAPSDRDFRLVWEPDLGVDPVSTLILESPNGKNAADHYALVMMVPPDPGVGVRLPREAIFIIDTSGSMEGDSIESAKEALVFGLETLRPSDRFNVIEFNSVMNLLFEAPHDADATSVAGAIAFVRALRAGGGTEMFEPLVAAMEQPASESHVRQIIFLTDGQVGNEDQIFDAIRQRLGDGRLFTVGIGSAPNSHFMSGAARFGRGTFTYIASANEVSESMQRLFKKLESPILTDVSMQIDDPGAEIWPAKIPDLYAGEPLVVTARITRLPATIHLSGMSGQKRWSSDLEATDGRRNGGIAKLWARRKIDSILESESDAAKQREQVVQVALDHHLVSTFTSLVAVDETPAGTVIEACETKAVPVNLPSGQSYEHIFGTLPRTATAAPLLFRFSALFAAAAIAIALVARRPVGLS